MSSMSIEPPGTARGWVQKHFWTLIKWTGNFCFGCIALSCLLPSSALVQAKLGAEMAIFPINPIAPTLPRPGLGPRVCLFSKTKYCYIHTHTFETAALVTLNYEMQIYFPLVIPSKTYLKHLHLDKHNFYQLSFNPWIKVSKPKISKKKLDFCIFFFCVFMDILIISSTFISHSSRELV